MEYEMHENVFGLKREWLRKQSQRALNYAHTHIYLCEREANRSEFRHNERNKQNKKQQQQ